MFFDLQYIFRRMRVLLVLLSFVLAGCDVATVATESPIQVPLYGIGTSGDVVPGQYIIVFDPGTSGDAIIRSQNQVHALGGDVLRTYMPAIAGFSARLPDEALKALRQDSSILYIEA